MRIRKHASRVLSSPSIPTPSCAAGSAAAVMAAAQDLEMSVCELNQSPWDVLPPTPPEGGSGHYFQMLRMEGEDEEGSIWGATGIEQEELPAAPDAFSVSVPVKAEEAGLPEKVAGRRTTSGKKMTRRKKGPIPKEGSKDCEVKMEVESAAKICNKSDGKGWSCKRDAQRPYSLCDHHLDQVRSYIQRQAPVQEKKKTKTKTKTKTKKRKKQPERGNCGGKSIDGEKAKRTRKQPSSDFYHYYYNGFGPGRGRRRDDGKERGTVDDGGLVIDGDGGGGGGSGGVGFLRDRPRRWLGDDDDDDDDDVVGDLGGECGGNDVIEIKRKGRKPIKARSLKSLL